MDVKRYRNLSHVISVVHYNLACSYSLLGSVNKALKSLGKAIDLGYNDISHLENDSDLG